MMDKIRKHWVIPAVIGFVVLVIGLLFVLFHPEHDDDGGTSENFEPAEVTDTAEQIVEAFSGTDVEFVGETTKEYRKVEYPVLRYEDDSYEYYVDRDHLFLRSVMRLDFTGKPGWKDTQEERDRVTREAWDFVHQFTDFRDEELITEFLYCYSMEDTYDFRFTEEIDGFRTGRVADLSYDCGELFALFTFQIADERPEGGLSRTEALRLAEEHAWDLAGDQYALLELFPEESLYAGEPVESEFFLAYLPDKASPCWAVRTEALVLADGKTKFLPFWFDIDYYTGEIDDLILDENDAPPSNTEAAEPSADSDKQTIRDEGQEVAEAYAGHPVVFTQRTSRTNGIDVFNVDEYEDEEYTYCVERDEGYLLAVLLTDYPTEVNWQPYDGWEEEVRQATREFIRQFTDLREEDVVYDELSSLVDGAYYAECSEEIDGYRTGRQIRIEYENGLLYSLYSFQLAYDRPEGGLTRDEAVSLAEAYIVSHAEEHYELLDLHPETSPDDGEPLSPVIYLTSYWEGVKSPVWVIKTKVLGNVPDWGPGPYLILYEIVIDYYTGEITSVSSGL